MIILETKNLVKNFGGIKAINDLSITVEKGSITGLIGPNGAGKTTFFNVITNFHKKDGGEVYFDGKRIDHLPTYKIAQIGLVRTYQIARELDRMTLLENMLIAPKNQLGEAIYNGFFKWRAVKKQEQENTEKAYEYLKKVGLYELRNDLAGNLPAGQKKLLEIARCLMLDPKMILLDEPMAGVNIALREKILDYIKELRDKGMTFLIVEHDISMIMSLCERIIVMHYGQKLAEGTPEEVKENPDVIAAYLGSQ